MVIADIRLPVPVFCGRDHAYAARFVTEARVDGVKLEATPTHQDRIVQMGIAVMGHVGLHPQAVGALGGLTVQEVH
jgi:3-methyl-2-oxobutanoate hydroxymethyltransferase